mgnify:CR=1 FL=1
MEAGETRNHLPWEPYLFILIRPIMNWATYDICAEIKAIIVKRVPRLMEPTFGCYVKVPKRVQPWFMKDWWNWEELDFMETWPERIEYDIVRIWCEYSLGTLKRDMTFHNVEERPEILWHDPSPHDIATALWGSWCVNGDWYLYDGWLEENWQVFYKVPEKFEDYGTWEYEEEARQLLSLLKK